MAARRSPRLTMMPTNDATNALLLVDCPAAMSTPFTSTAPSGSESRRRLGPCRPTYTWRRPVPGAAVVSAVWSVVAGAADESEGWVASAAERH